MSRTTFRAAAVLAGLVVLGGVTTSAVAGGGDSTRARLSGYQEVPAISTSGAGRFRAEIASRDDEIRYRLRYDDLSAPVTQAHIHFAQRSVNGGIVVFLCTNLGNGPAGTQPCPANGGTVTGRITPDDVLAVPTQGFAAGEFDELLDAIDAGATYVNVHTSAFPGGEVRGQLAGGHKHQH